MTVIHNAIPDLFSEEQILTILKVLRRWHSGHSEHANQPVRFLSAALEQVIASQGQPLCSQRTMAEGEKGR
jgi:hypothetical protein